MVTVLKIDVDWIPREGEDPRKWTRAVDWAETRKRFYEIALREMGFKVNSITWAWTSRGIHFYVVLEDDLPPEEQLKLQWVLGDDPVRCEINYRRLQRGDFPKHNILFDRVVWRRPPSDHCIKCRLWRWYMSEVKGSKPPTYIVEFDVTGEDYIDLIMKLDDIAQKDPSFTYRIEFEDDKARLLIYALDKDHAYKRGLWIKDKLLKNKRRFTVHFVSD